MTQMHERALKTLSHNITRLGEVGSYRSLSQFLEARCTPICFCISLRCLSTLVPVN
jgi:hypothetical protein